MNITIHMSQTRRERALVPKIASGFKRHGINVAVIDKPAKVEIAPNTDLAVFIGVKSRKVRDACVANGVPYLMIDKGYFKRGIYHRFALNGFTPCYLGSGLDSPERFLSFGLKVSNVRTVTARYVTFIGFDNKYAAFHGLGNADAYAASINDKLKTIIDTLGGRLELRMRSRAERLETPLSALLPHCHCIVTHGSIAGVEALLAGVPVVSLGQREANVVHSLSNDRLEDVVNPKIANSKDLNKRLAELAWCQFTAPEIQSGLAWEVIADQYKRL